MWADPDWYLANNTGVLRYKGIDTLKNPWDLWNYQEIIWDTKPDVVVETGTHHSGSAHYLADLGVEVHTVDLAAPRGPRPHPNITFYVGGSTNLRNLYRIAEACRGKRVMVILDSDHSRSHVLLELDAYSQLVTPGCYMIVEDTPLGRDIQLSDFPDGGPADALDDWLPDHPEFIVDETREHRFPLTEHPGGFLLRQ